MSETSMGDPFSDTNLKQDLSTNKSRAPADAVPIIITDEANHTFCLDEEALAGILLRPEVSDKKVAIVSVAGAFRKGKSFLLNFFLRYMKHQGKESDWIGEEDESLGGFSWRGGSERDTSGILMWKDPFLVTLPSGEEVVLLLVDTQGAFDSQSTVKDCATVFALSTMISSLQIYNLSQNIQEDDLQHLQLFTDYGRLALEDTNSKPFQSLLFLVRDWSFPYEAEYGFEGGSRVLEKRLQVSDIQHSELQQLRKYIRSCFEDIQCFLMPHPGLRVATNPDFNGQLSEIESEFKQQLKHLVPTLLAPENIKLKEINGLTITSRELLEYFKAYIKIFQGEELPEIKSMLLATAEANNLAAVANAKALYTRSMEKDCGGETAYMNQSDLDALHETSRSNALELFVDTRKMGGEDFSQQFLDKLDFEITEAYDNFVKVNNSKNLFRSAKTPAVLFVVLLVDYFVKELFEFVYMDFMARIFSSFLGIILLTISMWAYVRYSGSLREVGQGIDDLAEWLWDHVISPASALAVQTGVKHVSKFSNQHSNTSLASKSSQHSVQKKYS